MATADIGSAISGLIPTKAGTVAAAGSSFFWITIIVVILILFAIGAVVIIMIIRGLQFKKKIDIYEWRDGKAEWVGKDRAKELKYNMYGDTVFVLKKRKKFLPRGEIKVGKNRYLYGIRDDGEWINISLGDLNSALRLAEVKFIHPDMRAFKSGLAKIMKDRYEKKSFMKDILPTVLPIIFFVIMGIAMYFIADRLVAFLDRIPGVLDAAAKVDDKTAQILAGLNNICQTHGIGT